MSCDFSGDSCRRRRLSLPAVVWVGLALGLTATLGVVFMDHGLAGNQALAEVAKPTVPSADELSVEEYHQLQQLRGRLGLDTSSLVQADCDQVQAEQALSQMKSWWKSHRQELEQLDLQERQAENRCYRLLRQFHSGGDTTNAMSSAVSPSDIRSAAQELASRRRDRQQLLDQAREQVTGHLSMDQREEVASSSQRHRVARGELVVKKEASERSLPLRSSSQAMRGLSSRRSSSSSNAAMEVNHAESRVLPLPAELRQQMEQERQRMLQPMPSTSDAVNPNPQ